MLLARKINTLINLKRKPDGSTYSLSEIAREASRLYREQEILAIVDRVPGGDDREVARRAAEEITENTSPVLSRQFLSDLVNGKRRNPPFDKIVALGLFFGVSPAYFAIGAQATEETRAAEEEVEFIADCLELKAKLNTQGDNQGTELLGAVFRGAKAEEPQAVMAMLRMTLAAMRMTSREDSPPR